MAIQYENFALRYWISVELLKWAANTGRTLCKELWWVASSANNALCCDYAVRLTAWDRSIYACGSSQTGPCKHRMRTCPTFSICNILGLRNKSVVIKQRLRLHGIFPCGVVRPFIEQQGKRNGWRVQSFDWHLETELGTLPCRLLSEMNDQGIKYAPEHSTAPVGIPVCHCRFWGVRQIPRWFKLPVGWIHPLEITHRVTS